MEDSIAEKILKALDEHGEAFKKMGGRGVSLGWRNLSSRSLHEKDKKEYDMNKLFQKLTVKTIAMREKMEKMQLAFHKAEGMDDNLYNMGAVSSMAPIALPPKFKIFDAEKFDGTGDSK